MKKNTAKSYGYVAHQIGLLKNDPEYMATSWALRIAEEVVRCLFESGKNESWLAKKMGIDRAEMSKLLQAPTTMQLVTIAKLSVALGVSATIRLNTGRKKAA